MSENTQTQTAVDENQVKLDVIDQLLKPEVQESLTTLVDNLPKLTELVNLMTNSYDVIKSMATDEVLKSDTMGTITEMLHPIKESVKKVAATAIEAKDKADESHETIGLFGLLRIMKDPQAQKLFRFLNAYLEIANRKD